MTMRHLLYIAMLAAFACAPSLALASECGRPVSTGPIPGAVDSLYILQSAVGARDCRLDECDINSDCRISVSDALGVLRSAVGDDGIKIDCKSECPTIVRCGAEDAPMCNGTCPADYACMAVDDDGEDHDDRVTICHLPPGNLSNGRTLVLGESAVSAHLRHGDGLGPCEDLNMAIIASSRGGDNGYHEDGDSDRDGDDANKGDRDDDDGDCVCVPITITTSTTVDEATTTTMGPTTTTSTMASTTTTSMIASTTTTMGPTTTMAPTTTTTTTTTMASTTTTTMGPSAAAGQAIYDTRCGFCHGAGAHDTTNDSGGTIANRGSRLVNNLGALSGRMQGITLTSAEIADLRAFFNTL